MQRWIKPFYCILILLISSGALAQNLAARVLKTKRYTAQAPAIDPNAVAKPAAAPPSTNGAVVEEDLVNPSRDSRRELKPAPVPVPPPSAVDDQNPPPAQDPAKGLPPPPPSTQEMRPPPPSPRRESPGRRPHAGDLEEDGGTGVSLGIGFGSRSFSASLGLTFPIYRWLAWGISGFYYTWARDDDKETRYGPEGSLILRIPSRLPITPFGGIGAGYETWSRKQLDEVFDARAALTSLYFVGISIPMAEHLAINISNTWKTFLGTPPKQFEDHNKYERYGSSRFDIGLSVVF